MTAKPLKGIGIAAVMVTTALAGATPALAATHHRSHAKRHRTASTQTSSSGSSNGETALTGSTLASASAAAIAANPGATVDSATTETDSTISGAAYEVHITQADGTHAVVIEDSSFTVLATQTDGGCGGANGETALTGSTLASASAAAIAANPGATVDFATTETDSTISGAAYEVHITQADGTHAVVIEDSSFTVLATQAETHGPAQGPPPFGGPRR